MPRDPYQQAQFQEMLRRGWAPPAPGHPLARLAHGHAQGRTPLVLVGLTNRVGAHYFQVFLPRGAQVEDAEPALAGLCNRGHFPPQSWVEVAWSSAPHTPTEDDLFRLLGQTVQPGGHMMVEYESPERQATRRALAAGVPPLLTPLGAALFQAGCGWGFKDWDISEGWSEGPRKLQGFKALDPAYGATKAHLMAAEALEFLRRPRGRDSDVVETARALARRLLPRLHVDDPQVHQAILREVGRGQQL